MKLIFVILCWITWGIAAVSWLRFDTITMWICRPHYWWESREIILCISIFTLMAAICTTALYFSRFAKRALLAHREHRSATSSVPDLGVTQ